MEKLYFVHIPKTAGTSFREDLERYFKGNIVLDYGPEAVETSKIVRSFIYDKNDTWEFFKNLNEKNIYAIAGHVWLKKYLYGMGLRNTVLFLRNPAQRLYSEYNHFIRHKKYQKDFPSFYKSSASMNTQSRRFANLPVEAIGFVGLTENYDRSIDMINDTFDLELKSLVRNKGRWLINREHHIDPEDLLEIERLHHSDYECYYHACRLFEQREMLFLEGLHFVHGVLTGIAKQQLRGWAWWSGDRDDPVDILVRVNGQIVGSVLAKTFRPNLCQYAPPRDGYVGFELPVSVQSGDKVDCQVRETGQVFPLDPLVIE